MAGVEGIDRWDRLASEYSEWVELNSDPAGRAFAEAIRQAIVEELPSDHQTRALDFGCGDGVLLGELTARYQTVVGFDGSCEMVALARRRRAEAARLTFVADAARELPFADAAFDLVVASMVLMCVGEVSTAISEVSRILRGGGEFILTITHPCFSFVRRHLASGAHRYLDLVSTEHQLGPTFEFTVRHYHRPLQFYTSELARNGLVLGSILEISPQVASDSAILERMRPYALTANAILLHAHKGSIACLS